MRALREAGPPIRWIVAAIPLALAAVVVLYVAGVDNQAVLLAIPFVAFVLVGLIDQDGWRIRMAMAEVAGAPARAVAHGAGSRSIAPSADAWLDRASRCPSRPHARPMLGTVGRREEAIALSDAAVRRDATGRVGTCAACGSCRLTADGRRSTRSEASAALDDSSVSEIGGCSARRGAPLPAAVAAPWSIAWLRDPRRRAVARRDSRTPFATSGPSTSPVATSVFHAIQQFALPIAYVRRAADRVGARPGRRPAARLICDNRAIDGR